MVMPAFDRTGPRGQGPGTGRGFGYCVPTAGSSYGQSVVYGVGRGGIPRGGGRGFAFGGGRGRGRRFGKAYPYAPVYSSEPAPVRMTAEQEIAGLQEQSQMLQDQLNQINARIEDLTSEQE